MTVEQPGLVAVSFKRDRSGEGMGCDHRLLLDGKPFVDLRREEMVRVFVHPGDHVIGALAQGMLCRAFLRETSIRVEAGRPLVFRTAGDQAGGVLVMPTAF